MTRKTENRKVAIIATNGVEEIELLSPANALAHAGFTTCIVSPEADQVQSRNGTHVSEWYDTDVQVSAANVEAFDGVLIPGGLLHMDALRANADVIEFVKAMANAGKPIFAVGYGPQLLISADLVSGRCMTSASSIRKDLMNAGAEVSETAVVVDGALITCRNVDDFKQFNEAIVTALQASLAEPVAA